MADLACKSRAADGAFDAIAAMKAAPTIGDLSAAAGIMFSRLGLPYFALARFYGRSGNPDVSVLDGAFHAEWSDRYVASGYGSVSQIARELMLTSSPYSWDDVMTRRSVSPAQRRIRDEANEMGLADGLATPIAWADGSYVAVALSGPDRILADPETRIWAEILSSYYGCEARRLLAAGSEKGVRLSRRQLECLTWVRHGKSSSMISDILGLSVQTVDDHIAEACRKLRVRTRVQAAVEASLLGLID